MVSLFLIHKILFFLDTIGCINIRRYNLIIGTTIFSIHIQFFFSNIDTIFYVYIQEEEKIQKALEESDIVFYMFSV